MAVPLSALQALASSFSAVREGAQTVQPGASVTARVLGPDALTAADLVAAPISLAWIAKSVRFNTPNTEAAMTTSPFNVAALDALLAGGMPARLPVVGNVVGTEQLNGVPGELGQLAGSFPVPVEVPVQVGIVWEVLDADGVTVLPEGAAFTAPNGLTSESAVFRFAAQTVELTGAPPPTVQRFIRATVTLTATGTAHTFMLPNIPVTIPAIPLPVIVVYFRHTTFAAANDGAALIVVPNNSPLQSASQVTNALSILDSAVSSLTFVAEFAAFLTGITTLRSALGAQPHVVFRRADSSNEIDNFNNIDLFSGFWNDTEAEDQLSSMILIGPDTRAVKSFNARDENVSEGAFVLTIGPKFHAIVGSLHHANPPSTPDGNELNVTNAARTFGDELSSMRFI